MYYFKKYSSHRINNPLVSLSKYLTSSITRANRNLHSFFLIKLSPWNWIQNLSPIVVLESLAPPAGCTKAQHHPWGILLDNGEGLSLHWSPHFSGGTAMTLPSAGTHIAPPNSTLASSRPERSGPKAMNDGGRDSADPRRKRAQMCAAPQRADSKIGMFTQNIVSTVTRICLLEHGQTCTFLWTAPTSLMTSRFSIVPVRRPSYQFASPQ